LQALYLTLYPVENFSFFSHGCTDVLITDIFFIRVSVVNYSFISKRCTNILLGAISLSVHPWQLFFCSPRMHECFHDRHFLNPCIRGNLSFVSHGCTNVFRTGFFFIRGNLSFLLATDARMFMPARALRYGWGLRRLHRGLY